MNQKKQENGIGGRWRRGRGMPGAAAVESAFLSLFQ